MTRKLIAVDTETTGLRPFQGDKATVVSFCDDTGAWALPADQAAPVLRRYIDEGYTVINHNGPFDRAVFAASFGIELPDNQYDDTQAREWQLDENQDLRLKEGLALRYLGVDAKQEKDELRALMRGRRTEDVYRELRETENVRPRAERERAADTRLRAREIAAATKRSWEDLTFAELEEYAAQDAFITWQAYWRQEERFAEDPYCLPDRQRQLDIGSQAYRITRAGVRVNEARAEEELAKVEGRLAELSAPVAHVNLRSPKQVAGLLYDEWKLPCSLTTGSGARSTSKAALESLSWDPRVADFMEARRLVKQIDAYYLPLLDRLSPDGRVHPSLNPWRTVTGRYSCSGPNLHTIPRESTAAEIRKVFIPAPGMRLTEWDLSQIEPRAATDMSQEPSLLEVYAGGIDLYDTVAQELGITRQAAKVVFLSILYGVGGKTLATWLAQGTGKAPDVRRAWGIINRYWSRYRHLERLYKGLEEMGRRRGYLPLWKPGRRRRFRSPAVKFPRYYTGLNACIQGGAAEFLKDVLLELEPAVAPYGQIVLTVHDSIVVEHEPGAEESISRLIDEIGGDCSPYGIPTPWESKAWEQSPALAA